MRYPVYILFAMIAFGTVCPSVNHTLYAQDAAAMVTAVEGKATVEAGGITTALEIGSQLAEGAVVRLEEGTASLVFMSGDLMELAAGDVLQLGADMTSSKLTSEGNTRGVTSQDGVTVAEDGIGKANTEKWQSQLAYIYGVRGDPSVVAVAPRLAIAAARPVFYWFDPDSLHQGEKRSYTFTIKDGKGKAIHTATVSGEVYMLNGYAPESMPPAYLVEPGLRYSWSVAPKNDGDAGESASYIYIDQQGIDAAMMKNESLARLRDEERINEQTYHSLLCMYYLDDRERLFSDAIPHLLALSAKPEGTGYAYTQLALLLNRFGNECASAAAYYARKAR